MSPMPTDAPAHVTCTVTDGVATIAIDDGKANALSHAVLAGVETALDQALVVSEKVAHDALMQALQADAEGLVRIATLFDIYKPKEATADIQAGERSLAVRLELLDDGATLTDERIDSAVAAALLRVQTTFGARLRG